MAIEPAYRRCIVRGATLSSDGIYRYDLIRQWSSSQNPDTVVFIGLNPSTADATLDDPTIRKCVEFSSRLGGERLVMVNLFAFRATDPDALRRPNGLDLVGPDNDATLRQWTSEAHRIILGWGVHGTLHGRDKAVLAMLPRDGRVSCLKRTKDGHPSHPLYIPYATQLLPWF